MTVQTVADILAGTCLISGALLSLAAGVGLLRFPDLLSRMHAATKPQVLGLLLILAGTALRLQNTIDITTLVLIGVFQLVTAPVAAHMIGRAVYRSGQVRADLLVVDELADDRANGGPEPRHRPPER
jgi:multicomponent Na+:H+ antiporter subunit G